VEILKIKCVYFIKNLEYEKEVDNKKLYEILGVDKNAD